MKVGNGMSEREKINKKTKPNKTLFFFYLALSLAGLVLVAAVVGLALHADVAGGGRNLGDKKKHKIKIEYNETKTKINKIAKQTNKQTNTHTHTHTHTPTHLVGLEGALRADIQGLALQGRVVRNIHVRHIQQTRRAHAVGDDGRGRGLVETDRAQRDGQAVCAIRVLVLRALRAHAVCARGGGSHLHPPGQAVGRLRGKGVLEKEGFDHAEMTQQTTALI